MKKALIIGFVWPEPNSSAAGSHMIQLINNLQQEYTITFASAASESEYMFDLDHIGVTKQQIAINDTSFDDFIKNLQPDIVVFDRFMTEEQFGWRVAMHTPDAIRILNTEDLHSLRKTREEAFKKNIPHTPQLLLSSEYTKRELASIHRSDCSLIISEHEIDLLKNTFLIPENQLCYYPLTYPEINRETKNSWASYDHRKHFITIGNFRHAPNWNSIRYLKEKIWPAIRAKLPDAALHIYGSYPPEKALQLHHASSGFLIKGWAKNAADVMGKARVCLAPLQFGAGIKGKLIDAMRYGTPSITTVIGAEGMQGEADWNGFITDTPEKLAQAAIYLYTHKNIWEQSQQNGIEIINTRFQESAFRHTIINQINQIAADIKTHRNQNFTGAMLLHHTMKSNEYMSRWIEEKNKPKS
ncbi:glycosyltransferase family 4 protein [Aquimarina sp. TRL1]|uniref:glycosyltransferase n=1 Tax=Aquimarina sp. (strain TRL1) TaxID=2736252 RepID=UPI00158B0A5F|nr:glycosyltransferase [Aquimarina sp. TRL1]QKX03523.1 glycosyltransferase family 4 protein [Aquimarina sp. TRL1]